jgi:transposase
MPDSHPVELRIRVVEAYKAGKGSLPEIADAFGVGEASAKRWVWLFNDSGSVEPARRAGGRRSIITEAALVAIIAELKDPTASEITARFNRDRTKHERVHVSSIKRALHRHGYVVKKSADGHWRLCGRTLLSGAKST